MVAAARRMTRKCAPPERAKIITGGAATVAFRQQKESSMSRQSDTLVAFLLGAVAGASVALLLAPDKGSETRKKIRTGVGTLYRKGEGWVDETSHAATERARAAVDVAKSKLHEVEEAARSHASALKEAVAEGREAYRREMGRDPGKS